MIGFVYICGCSEHADVACPILTCTIASMDAITAYSGIVAGPNSIHGEHIFSDDVRLDHFAGLPVLGCGLDARYHADYRATIQHRGTVIDYI